MTEFRPGGFQILPPIIKNLLIINVLVLLAQTMLGEEVGSFIADHFALHTWQSDLFQPWQFITYMFLHGNFWHLFSNMFALWMFGSVLEGLWGPKRFLTFYLVCGLGAALLHMGVLYYENHRLLQAFNAVDAFTQQENRDAVFSRINEATLGASGAVFGCLAAFGFLFPNDYMYLYFAIPVKVKWVVIVYILLELEMTVQNSAGDNVAHVAHLGGAIVGFLLAWFWRKDNRPHRRNFY